MPEDKNCQNCPEHSGVVVKLKDNAEDIGDIKDILTAIFNKMDDLTAQVLSRHGWATTIIISVLVSLLGIAVTVALFLANHGE